MVVDVDVDGTRNHKKDKYEMYEKETVMTQCLFYDLSTGIYVRSRVIITEIKEFVETTISTKLRSQTIYDLILLYSSRVS